MAYPDFSAAFNSIAAVSISGVRVYSMANMPDSLTGRECPCLVPISATASGDEPGSMGLAGSALYMPRITLSYAYFHAPIGSSRTVGYQHDAALQKVTAIIAAIRGVDTTLTNIERITLAGVEAMGEIDDPDPGKFFGCPISFNLWYIKQ